LWLRKDARGNVSFGSVGIFFSQSIVFLPRQMRYLGKARFIPGREKRERRSPSVQGQIVVLTCATPEF
jgi:hypothetical protein